ncbi:MAG: response regulator [Mangrovibacterium sp.]
MLIKIKRYTFGKNVDKMSEKLSILLVEDNMLNQKVVTFSLKKLESNIMIANNGLEGVELFKSNKFDFILMDIMMPIMDGLEATKKIREYERENNIERTPIIAVTANTLDNDRDKCIQYGMDEFMSKPFSLPNLREILEEIGIHI